MAFEARIHFATSMANELEELKVHEFRIRRSVLYLLARGAFLWIVGLFVVLGFDRVLLQAASENSWSVGSLVFDFDTIANFSLWSHVVLFTLYGALSLFVVLHWYYEYYLIQPDSIFVHRGIVFSSEQAFQMEDIKSIEIIQGMFGKIFNTGTVKLFAHRAQQYVLLSGVRRPAAIAAHIQRLHPSPESVLPVVSRSGNRQK
jgi:membrane protein YdbS with pleckstrin-like domain